MQIIYTNWQLDIQQQTFITYFPETSFVLSKTFINITQNKAIWKKCCRAVIENLLVCWGGGGAEHVVSGQQNLWLETDKGGEERCKLQLHFQIILFYQHQ